MGHYLPILSSLLAGLFITIIICVFKKQVLHFEYHKKVNGNFKEFNSRWEPAFMFNFFYIIKKIGMTSPFFSRNRAIEKESPEFMEMGKKLKRIANLYVFCIFSICLLIYPWILVIVGMAMSGVRL